MSLARALKSTASELGVGLTAYTAAGEWIYDEAPPVPQIPQVYAHIDEEDRNFEAEPSSSPLNPEQSNGPIPKDGKRQTDYDIALARLEGTYISPMASTTPSIAGDEARRSENNCEDGFDKWLEQQKREQARRERRERIAQRKLVLGIPPTPIVKDTFNLDVTGDQPADSVLQQQQQQQQKQQRRQCHDVPPAPMQYEHTFLPRNARQAQQHPGAGITAADRIREYTKPASAALAAARYDPRKDEPIRPNVEPSKLKDLAKKAKGLFKEARKRRPSGDEATHIHGQAGLEDLNVQPAPRSNTDHSLQPSTSNNGTSALPRPPPKQTKYNPALQDPSTSDQVWNGIRKPDDIRKPLPPLISIEEAQQKLVGRPELSPLFVAERRGMAAPREMGSPRIVGDPKQRICMEDFMNNKDPSARDLPQTANEIFEQRPTNDEVQKVTTDHIIHSPDLSPNDIGMTRFDSAHSSCAHLRSTDPQTFGDEVGKLRRESKLLEFRDKNASRESVPYLTDEEMMRERRMHKARELARRKKTEREEQKHGRLRNE